MKFNLCLMNTSVHTQCFLEVMDGISWALQKLGHDVKHEPLILQDRWNIVFGARESDEFGEAKNVILYNGEQATLGSFFPVLSVLYNKHVVWDYSTENAARYANYALPKPSVVRPGYAPVLDRVPEVEKTYDVVFFGSKNERRTKVLDKLRAAGVKVLEIPFGTYGRERDLLLAQAKFCLNVHYYQNAIFESVRCSYCMMNGIPVISEALEGQGVAYPWDVLMYKYDRLVAAAVRVINDPEDGVYGCEVSKQRKSAVAVSLLDDVRVAVAALPDLVMEQDEVAPIPLADKQYKITLSMIVKNEKDVIERCLRSMAPYLTGYCVVDTGSTDGTQDIIRRTMESLGIPGEVHDCEWKEFDGSRTEALELAQKQCGGEGWLMLADADEIIHVQDELKINEAFDGHYMLVSRCLDGCPTWPRPFLLRASRKWFYEMPRHEGLYSRESAPLDPVPLTNVRNLSTHDGARAKEGAKERFTRDAQILEKWLLQHPGHARATYYIAQSYKDAGGTDQQDKSLLQKAVMWYQRRAQMPGWDVETFSAMYQAANWMAVLGYPIEKVQHIYLQAYQMRPSRAEPLYQLGHHYMATRQYALGALFSAAAAAIPRSYDPHYDVQPEVYSHAAKDDWATCLTYLNGHAKALELFEEVLERVPGWDRQRILDNIAMCKRTLGVE